MVALPVDIWLMVLDEFDIDTLWSTIRNVSQYLRDCVDEFFRRSILPETVINLVYSTIHSALAPPYRHMYLPMQFSHFSEDGVHAVFRQVSYKYHNPNESHDVKGSVRGWVPFIERYCKEMKKAAPKLLNKSNSTPDPPRWTTTFPTSSSRTPHAGMLSQHTSVGRGDRPPYFILISKHVHDTELVDLTVDCAAQTLSFDWRRTFSAFFMEAHFITLAMQAPGRLSLWTHDKALTTLELDPVAMRRMRGCYWPSRRIYTDAWREARRKRLEGWVKTNQTRMSLEHRFMTEGSVNYGRDLTMRQFYVSDMSFLSHFRYDEPKEQLRVVDLLVELNDDDVDMNEVVPERCAKDCRDLMMWPDTRRQRKEVEYVPTRTAKRYSQPCVVQ